MSATVNIAELDAVTKARVLQQIEGTEGAESASADPTQISNLDISNRTQLIERLTRLHNNAKQAYALRDEHRREAGKILLLLRTKTLHGEWEPQLQEICIAIGMSRSTAHNYMNAAEKGSVPKPNSAAIEKAKEAAQHLQDACKNAGMNVEISPSRETGKFHLTYRNLSEVEIQQALDSFQAKAKREVQRE